MQLLKDTHINFLKYQKMAMIFSVVLILVGIGSLATRGLNFGLDFTGGTLIEVEFPTTPDLSMVRGNLDSAGFGEAVVQTFGTPNDIIVRLGPHDEEGSPEDVSGEVLAALQQGVEGEIDLRRVEFVGPQIGAELQEKGGLAMLWTLGFIFLYIMFRFQWRFSVGAVVALAHDILLSIGVLSILQIEFDLTVVAALLAVIGYSLNDTIVLYDRIRENFRRLRKDEPPAVVNESINQTLSRTVMTSLTTLLVLIALFIFGGEIIHSFAYTLIIGVIIGTYSSIYIASPVVLMLGVSKQDLAIIEKEGVGAGDMP